MSNVASALPERTPQRVSLPTVRGNPPTTEAGLPGGPPGPAIKDEPLLVVEDLRITARTRRGDAHVVDGVSLSVDRGSLLALVGESGSGKTLTGRAILGLLPRPGLDRCTGRVLIDGADILSLPESARRKIRGRRAAMVFQDPAGALNPYMRIGTQIALPLRQHLGLRGAAAKQRAIELLTEVGIPDPEARLRSYPHELSGGMCQRVMLAIALSCEPELLVADEPTTALDVTVQAQVLRLVQHLRRERGMAVVLITHDLAIVKDCADDVAVMYAGRVVEAAPANELFARPRMPYTRGLLESVPTMEQDRRQRLHGIDGRPAEIIGARTGCAFAPRCRHATQRCAEADPTLEAWTPTHGGACWHPQDGPLATAAANVDAATGAP